MLVLVHHAEAADAALDPQRPLTAAGLAHAARVAEAVRARGVVPAVIHHSGKLRARQTAECFWRACNPLAEFSAARDLQPSDPPERIRDSLVDERDVMLVGHMPHLARLLELLTARAGGAAAFPLHGVVAVRREGAGWIEMWREE